MAFFGPFWWFLLCAVLDFLVGLQAFSRYNHGKAKDHRWEWQWSRILVATCSILAGFDCLRIFFGGYWDKDEPPLFAYSIYPLNVVHLVLVPLQMMPNTEFQYASQRWWAYKNNHPVTGDSPLEVKIRLAVAVVAVLLALLGLQTVIQRWRATMTTGLIVGEEYGGIVTWTLADLEMAHELGYWVIPESLELVGIFSYAFYSVIIGGIIIHGAGSHGYFILQMIGLVGQVLSGAVLGAKFNAFSYGSNFFEVVAFGSMVWADISFFELRGGDPLNKISSAHNLNPKGGQVEML